MNNKDVEIHEVVEKGQWKVNINKTIFKPMVNNNISPWQY
jgi:hypothetical protein